MEKICQKYWTGGGGKFILRCEGKTKPNSNDRFSKVRYVDINESFSSSEVVGTKLCSHIRGEG